MVSGMVAESGLKGVGVSDHGWSLLLWWLCLPVLSQTRLSPSGAANLMLLSAVLMASHDLASRRIPNALCALTALAGMVWSLGWQGLPGLGLALAGGLIAFGFMVLFFFLGAVGAGDVKALAALATFCGPLGAIQLLVYTALAGGLVALAVMVVNRVCPVVIGSGLRSLITEARGLTLPYGVAIALGTVALISAGGVP